MPNCDKVNLRANILTNVEATYTGENIKPYPIIVALVICCNVVCFGGRLSKYHSLNHTFIKFLLPIKISNTAFANKLYKLKFNDHTQAQNITNASDCGEMKRLGHYVSNFNQIWKSVTYRNFEV